MEHAKPTKHLPKASKEELATVGLGYVRVGDITENDIRKEQGIALRSAY